MIPTCHSNSPEMTQERRVELYNSLGRNLQGYCEQLEWYSMVCSQYPNDVCMLSIFRLSYIGTDLCSSIRACLMAKDEYERRYQIKYLWVNLYEAYNAIYNDESDAHSYLHQFAEAYPTAPMTSEYFRIVEKLELLKQAIREDVRAPRNSFSHYDTNVCQTINMLYEINSEEAPAHYCCELLEILQLLIQMCRGYLPVGMKVPIGKKHVNLEKMVEEMVRARLSSNERLITTMHDVISSVSTRMRLGHVICTFREGLAYGKKSKIYSWDVCMLIEILRADLAAALLSGLRSNLEFECRLNMRRIRIIHYEGLFRISEMLGKLNGKNTLRQEILGVLDTIDAQQRHAAVHYRFGEKDYIPVAYADNIRENETIGDLIDVIPFLNQLNGLVERLK